MKLTLTLLTLTTAQNFIKVDAFVGTDDPGFVDGTTNARFNFPRGITLSQDFIYISDTTNNAIRTVTKTGTVSTIAGNGLSGYKDGIASLSEFSSPLALCIDKNGTLYVADSGNNVIRNISTTGIVSTFAGNGVGETLDGSSFNASFNQPRGLVFDSNILYVSESFYIRKIVDGVVSTVAGTGVAGSTNGDALSASFKSIQGIAFKNNKLLIADMDNHLIRILSNGIVETFAGTGQMGNLNGQALESKFSYPSNIIIDDFGTVYVADRYSYQIRKISNGVVSVLAGTGTPGSLNGFGDVSSFYQPFALTFDSNNRFYVSDRHSIRTMKMECLGGYYTNGTVSECLICPENTFSGLNSVNCTICPNTTVSLQGSSTCSSSLGTTFSYVLVAMFSSLLIF